MDKILGSYKHKNNLIRKFMKKMSNALNNKQKADRDNNLQNKEPRRE